MKNLTLLLALIFLFGGLSYAGTHQTNSIKRHKSGSYTIIGENRSNTYDKYGKKKSSTVQDSFGNKTITKYDKKIRKPNGSSRTYDQKGKLIKRTDVTNY